MTKQLRCSGVFEAVRVIGMGYPDRLPYFTIYGQYAHVVDKEQRPALDDDHNPIDGEVAAAQFWRNSAQVF